MNKFLNFFKWQSMIKENQIVGEIPSNSKIYKKTFDIAWPSALESVSMALIGAVDMMMVGNLGANAIAGVGISTQPKFLLMAPNMAVNIAVTVLVSRRKGEDNRNSANEYLLSAWFISGILAFFLSLLGIIFAPQILKFSGANMEYLDLAVDYFRIVLVGNFFYCMALTISSAQRGVGLTKISLKINLAANLVNLVFNALLINGLFFFPRLEVVGAAIATTIGNFIAFVISVKSITNSEEYLYIGVGGKIIDLNAMKDIYKISSTSVLEQLFLRVGFLMYSKSVAGLGTLSFAAHQVTMNMMHMSFSIGDGLSIATSSLVGQSLGSQRSDMAIIHGLVSQRIGVFLAILTSISLIVFRVPLLLLFTNDLDVIKAATLPMTILSVCVLFQIPQVILVGSLRGAGDIKFVATLMFISVSILRPGLAYLLIYPLNLGLVGAWLSVLLDQITRSVVSSSRFKKAEWINIEV
ncbi:MAG: MATE family efflux transporter [Erysipelotrichaceae bacterium]|nr:MATE family efflux transporter [Erysipelotrichaceae bacterium]